MGTASSSFPCSEEVSALCGEQSISLAVAMVAHLYFLTIWVRICFYPEKMQSNNPKENAHDHLPE